MKKIYSTPVCEIVTVEACEMLASSILPGDGGPATDILPGDGEFDGEFNSNSESGVDIW